MESVSLDGRRGIVPYLTGTALFDFEIHHLRQMGIRNFLTLHYTNFFEGIGFMGVFDHYVATMFPSHRSQAFLATLAVLTISNWGFELAPGLWNSSPDWPDFLMGEAGMFVYILITTWVEHAYQKKILRDRGGLGKVQSQPPSR